MSNQIKLSITGMSCGHCVATVEKSIAAVEGVEDAVVSLDEGNASVNGEVTAATLIDAVIGAGFGATEIGG